MTRPCVGLIAAVACVCSLVSIGPTPVVAQSGAAATTRPSAGEPPTTQPSAESIEAQLLNQLEANPIVPPTKTRFAEPTNRHDTPALEPVALDPRVLGVAPGRPQPKLRREGEFIVNRRGRLVQASNGHQMLFVFEADSDAAPEPPMILTSCQMLQNMENIVRERGDQIVFIVSGQVLVYRGANHLLPSMMRLAIDHGNLEN